MVRGDVTAARAPSRKREQGRQMCRCRCHRRRVRVRGGAGAAGAAGEPGRVERGPWAAAGWGAPLATSGHPSSPQGSSFLVCSVDRVWGAGVGATCVQAVTCHSEPSVVLVGPQFPRFAGAGCERIYNPRLYSGFFFAKLEPPN